MARKFNGFNFDDGSTYKVLTIDAFSVPQAQIIAGEYARRHGGQLLDRRWRPKAITIGGIARGTSPEDVLANIDTLHGSLSPQAGTLEIHYGSEDRYYIATLDDFRAPVGQRGGNYAMWDASFQALSPFAYASSGSSQAGTPTQGSIAAGEYAGTFNLPTAPATAPCEPAYTLTIGTADYGITSLWLVNTSVSPDRKLIVNQSFAGAGTVVINSNTYAVTVNGSAAQDTEGAFPPLDPSAGGTSNEFEIHAKATAQPTIAYDASWTARYLT